MKEKPISIKKSSKNTKSPHALSWPKKQESEQVSVSTVGKNLQKNDDLKIKEHIPKVSYNPDLLFHQVGSGNKVFQAGLPTFSLKATHIVIFIVFLSVLVTPFFLRTLISAVENEKQILLAKSNEAITNWERAYASLKVSDFSSAADNFDKAEFIFQELSEFPQQQHPFIISVLDTFPVKPKAYQSYHDLVRAGLLVSNAGSSVVHELTEVSEKNDEGLASLATLESRMHEATGMLTEAHFLISRVPSTALPLNLQSRFLEGKKFFDDAITKVTTLDELVSLASQMVGFNAPKLWMFVFQNNAELRASGGFMGSYGLAKVTEGELELIDIPGGGTYDLRGSFRKNVMSPDPLHLINPVWEFQDSNWWPDWPTTAKKIIWFYEQGDGATVDGVLSFTPSFLERVLDITGPVALEGDYGYEIDKYSAYTLLQSYSDEERATSATPKKIIGDLAKVLIENKDSLIGPDQFPELISLLLESIESKQLLVYWNEPNGQEVLAKNGLDGSLVDSGTDDYFMAVHTNIAGGKSDRDIRDVISIDSTILETGEVQNTVRLTRTHHGKEGTGFSGVRNVDYVRMYVPDGATLLSASGFTKPDDALFEKPPEGFEPDNDYLTFEEKILYDDASGTEVFHSFGKTVFANWLMVDPGESKTVTVTYTLPDLLQKTPEAYTTYIQKQPGWQGAQVAYALSWPKSWNVGLINGSTPGNAHSVRYESNLTKDIHLTTKWDASIYAKK